MSMVLKTHSVNFLSFAAEVWDSSCSLWLSSQSLLIWAWSRSFSSRSCERMKGREVNAQRDLRQWAKRLIKEAKLKVMGIKATSNEQQSKVYRHFLQHKTKLACFMSHYWLCGQILSADILKSAQGKTKVTSEPGGMDINTEIHFRGNTANRKKTKTPMLYPVNQRKLVVFIIDQCFYLN